MGLVPEVSTRLFLAEWRKSHGANRVATADVLPWLRRSRVPELRSVGDCLTSSFQVASWLRRYGGWLERGSDGERRWWRLTEFRKGDALSVSEPY